MLTPKNDLEQVLNPCLFHNLRAQLQCFIPKIQTNFPKLQGCELGNVNMRAHEDSPCWGKYWQHITFSYCCICALDNLLYAVCISCTCANKSAFSFSCLLLIICYSLFKVSMESAHYFCYSLAAFFVTHFQFVLGVFLHEFHILSSIYFLSCFFQCIHNLLCFDLSFCQFMFHLMQFILE